jgi:hypothetical protein
MAKIKLRRELDDQKRFFLFKNAKDHLVETNIISTEYTVIFQLFTYI